METKTKIKTADDIEVNLIQYYPDTMENLENIRQSLRIKKRIEESLNKKVSESEKRRTKEMADKLLKDLKERYE